MKNFQVLCSFVALHQLSNEQRNWIIFSVTRFDDSTTFGTFSQRVTTMFWPKYFWFFEKGRNLSFFKVKTAFPIFGQLFYRFWVTFYSNRLVALIILHFRRLPTYLPTYLNRQKSAERSNFLITWKSITARWMLPNFWPKNVFFSNTSSDAF